MNRILFYTATTILACILFCHACQKPTFAPVAKFTTNTKVTYIQRMVSFDARLSSDPDGETFQLQSRWDFNNDGTWETDYSSELTTNWIFEEQGYQHVKVEIIDADGLTAQSIDSIWILGVYEDSLIVDPRDDEKYRIVKIKDLWVFAENLRYGTFIPTSLKQSDNGITEYYLFENNPDHFGDFGGLYSWDEATEYKRLSPNQGICPPGWRFPELEDWQKINILVPHAFLADYYGPDGLSGLDLMFSGYYLNGPVLPDFIGPHFSDENGGGAYWFNYKNTTPSGIKGYGFVEIYFNPITRDDLWKLNGLRVNKSSFDWRDEFGKAVPIESYLSVRCVKSIDP